MTGVKNHLTTVIEANKLTLDYNTYSSRKATMDTQAVVGEGYKCAMRQNFPESVMKKLKMTELPKKLQDYTQRESRVETIKIRELFKNKGDTGYDIFNMADEILEKIARHNEN